MFASKKMSTVSWVTLSVAAVLTIQGCESMVDSAAELGVPVQDAAVARVAPQPRAQLTQTEHTIAFAPGARTVTPRETVRLQSFMEKSGVGRTDRVSIVSTPVSASASTQQRLDAKQREQAVFATLTRLGYPVLPLPADVETPDAKPGTINVIVRRYIVRLPVCPDWTDSVWDNFGNHTHSNWGCATAINFGMMVDNPADLVQGRSAPIADGELQASSIERYRERKTEPLSAESPTSDTFSVNVQNSGK